MDERKEFGLSLILSITDSQAEKRLQVLMEEAHIPLRIQCHALGTASSELLRICGLGESDRNLTLCVLPKRAVHTLFEKMNDALQMKKRGKGIAVSIPLTGVQMNLARLMHEAHHPEQQFHEHPLGQEEPKMTEGTRYSMIHITVNEGYSDDVLDTAKNAGARGGTIIRGRRRGLDAPMQFWGISLQEEQEILLIIVPRELKKQIMQAVCSAHGLSSPAQGLVMSLPIEDVLGLED